jgi:hypothetical protein
MGVIQESFNDIFDNLFSPDTPKVDKEAITTEADEEGARAAEAERRRRNQTEANRSGSAASALSAAIGRSTLGGA